MIKKIEKPDASEGFHKLSTVKVQRWKLPARFCNAAVMIDYDGTVRDTKSGDKYPVHPNDVVAFPQAAKKLQALASKGIKLLGASNQSGVAKNKPTMEKCHECFQETNRQLGVDIEYDFDYSAAGPVTSWHRKPLPGLGVDAIWKHNLDPAKVVYVGDMTTDKTFAQRCGFRFEWAKDFFGL
jgi:HAD superfamily hydrolase (TIGR01662 family)